MVASVAARVPRGGPKVSSPPASTSAHVPASGPERGTAWTIACSLLLLRIGTRTETRVSSTGVIVTGGRLRGASGSYKPKLPSKVALEPKMSVLETRKP